MRKFANNQSLVKTVSGNHMEAFTFSNKVSGAETTDASRGEHFFFFFFSELHKRD